jgi:GrpB-like predicted nucleotidyltransferase (UPF0157 family)/GNAT superfamily N-acetyltransferase
MSNKVQVVPYDPNWPKMFEAEEAIIRAALGQNCVAVHHVGSTSVPGLSAKPKIDILIVVKNLAACIPQLEKYGYANKGEFNIPFHLVFRERDGGPRANIHVYEEGSPEIELNLLFRNYLREHADWMQKYGSLKMELSKQESARERGSHGLSQYTLGKDTLIKQILKLAGFQGICMRHCTHHDEWDAARKLRQRYFFDNVPVADPYTWTFNKDGHVHFVLHKGTAIVGYAHIQLWPEQRAAIRIIVVDETFRNHGLGSHFLALIERWLKGSSFKVLQTQSSPNAYTFYVKNHYVKMPFNDPDGHESDARDIEMGKQLD